VRGVALGRRGEEPVVDRRDVLQPLRLRFPLDVRVPEPVRPELEPARRDGPLELRPDVLLVVGFGGLHVGEVVDPQVDRQGNRFQASLEYLYNRQLEQIKLGPLFDVYLFATGGHFLGLAFFVSVYLARVCPGRANKYTPKQKNKNLTPGKNKSTYINENYCILVISFV
jgi:hypothetical protein